MDLPPLRAATTAHEAWTGGALPCVDLQLMLGADAAEGFASGLVEYGTMASQGMLHADAFFQQEGALFSSTAPAEDAEAFFPGLLARSPRCKPARDGADADDGAASLTGQTEAGRKRSSRFRGVTKHRRSGRYEAHVWVRETGKQVYLGGYAREEFAAEAFDVAALKCKGASKAKINFPHANYADLIPYLESVSLDELVMAIRRQSAGFARGSSIFRGVTHHPNGRWEARLGVPGQRHVYLGLFTEEEEAARAYDRALVRLRGNCAATNHPLAEYPNELREFEEKASGSAAADAPAPACAALPDGNWPFEAEFDALV